LPNRATELFFNLLEMFWELFEIFLVIQLVVAIDPTSNIFFVIAQKNSILTLGD
jgi:hypothetical protein